MRYLTLTLLTLLLNCSCGQTTGKKHPRFTQLTDLSKDDSIFVSNILRNEQPLTYSVVNSINGVVLTMSFRESVVVMILDKGEIVDMIEKGKDGKLIVYGGESDWLPIILSLLNYNLTFLIRMDALRYHRSSLIRVSFFPSLSNF